MTARSTLTTPRSQATYDLRRLRLKGLIERIDGTNTYLVTPYGRRIAIFLTKLAARVVVPTLTDLDNPSAPNDRPPTTHHRLARLRNRLDTSYFPVKYGVGSRPFLGLGASVASCEPVPVPFRLLSAHVSGRFPCLGRGRRSRRDGVRR